MDEMTGPETTGPVVPWMATLESIHEAAARWHPSTIWAVSGDCFHNVYFGLTFLRSSKPLQVGAVYGRPGNMVRLSTSHNANYRVLEKVPFQKIREAAKDWKIHQIETLLKSRFWYKVQFD